jgi:hypothetical protein
VRERGKRYVRPESKAGAWPEGLLREYRRAAVGDVPILVEMPGGGAIVGLLEEVGAGVLHVDGRDLACDRIEAFTLIPAGPFDHRRAQSLSRYPRP